MPTELQSWGRKRLTLATKGSFPAVVLERQVAMRQRRRTSSRRDSMPARLHCQQPPCGRGRHAGHPRWKRHLLQMKHPRLICALRSMPTVVRMEPPKRWQGCFAGPIRLQVHSTPGTAVLVAGQPPQPQSSARRAEQPAATSIPPPPRAMWPHGTWWESCVAGAHL